MESKLRHTPIIFACLLLVTACGYHLRGTLKIPEAMKKVYIEGASAPLQSEFTASLSSSKGQVVDSAGKAGVMLDILSDQMTRRVLSLNATGKAIEFELNYRVRYRLLRSEEDEGEEEQEVEVNREYFNDQEDILAKNNEEGVIRKEMYRQAVRVILTRTRAVLSQ